MEAQAAASGGCGGGGGGGEVRRVHIIYFLSRKGRIEHPHLIRVHHLSRNGVRLRDVKRWLSELRGKDMPDNFSWSYKRKYKAGYVWQDLLDEDLITPISDNEYVLKGSEISSTTFMKDLQKEVLMRKKSSPPFEVDAKDAKIASTRKEAQESSPSVVSAKTSFEIEELPSFGSETSTEDTTKHEEDKLAGKTTHEEEVQSQEKDKAENNNSFYETFLNKNKNINKSKKDDNKNSVGGSEASEASNYSFGKSSSYSGSGASHMFRNWISCGAVDTNESAVMLMNKRSSKTSLMKVFSEKNSKENNLGQISKGEKLGGSERISRSPWTQFEQQHNGRKSSEENKGSKKSKNSESIHSKTYPAAYKPINGPKCSQCGRQFKPEKLHGHMKSCRGMKAMAKSGITSLKTADYKPNRSTTDMPTQDSITGFYLTR